MQGAVVTHPLATFLRRGYYVTRVIVGLVVVTISFLLPLIMFSSPVIAAPVTVDSIVALSETGIGDDAVIAVVNASGQQFDLSVNEVVSLKTRGLSGSVLAAIINSGHAAGPRFPTMAPGSPDPSLPHPNGVYLLATGSQPARMQRIDPSMSDQVKSGGIFGHNFTFGIATLSTKAVIQNETARVQSVSNTPTFYFFFDESLARDGSPSGTWLSGTNATVSAPSELTLVVLKAKDGRREARVGSRNIAGVKSGVLDKYRIPFDYQIVRPGVYKVMPMRTLPSGEYGFVYAIGNRTIESAGNARIFDFSVR